MNETSVVLVLDAPMGASPAWRSRVEQPTIDVCFQIGDPVDQLWHGVGPLTQETVLTEVAKITGQGLAETLRQGDTMAPAPATCLPCQ